MRKSYNFLNQINTWRSLVKDLTYNAKEVLPFEYLKQLSSAFPNVEYFQLYFTGNKEISEFQRPFAKIVALQSGIYEIGKGSRKSYTGI